MADSLKDSVLAVDGGGTWCRFALERGGERVVTEAGSANALTDFDTTQRCLLEGLQSLAQIASTRAEALRPARLHWIGPQGHLIRHGRRPKHYGDPASGPHYAPFLPSDMRPSLAEPLGEPLDGAIALAQDMEMTNGDR